MEELLRLIQRRQSLIEQVKSLEDRRKALDGDIEELLGIGTHKVGSYSVIIQDTTETRFDSSSFRKEYPDLAAKFNKTGNKHIFRIVEVSE